MFTKYISDKELSKYGDIYNFSEKAKSLLIHQKENWELVANNYAALKSIESKRYNINGKEIRAQFNPSRIISSSAKVDKESIENRACFLCVENLPDAQKGIKLDDDYTILCNPYPIFQEHLTIPHIKHIPQSINNAFNDLLDLSYKLKDNFFVFYNGPKCGASAPDHLHFQAGQRFSTPLEDYYNDLLNKGKILLEDSEVSVRAVNEKLYKFIHIYSGTKERIHEQFKKILQNLITFNNSNEEPLLNIICFVNDDKWNLFVIPRKQHRPDQFYSEGNDKLLISPASVDMMGLLITPRKEDYENLTEEKIDNIYSQVLFDQTDFDQLSSNITKLGKSYS